jgi:tRNA (mo5U34)-methyltransferase
LWWFHRVDLGRGVVTKGVADFTWRIDQLPPVEGRSVLDIGAWHGGYSFMAEQNGASRVVALDHYAWGVDFTTRDIYWKDCADKGVLPDHSRDVTDFWCEPLPGRIAFDFAHEALNSQVEPVLADFNTMDVDTLGQFDVVLYLGVLYHMPEPLHSLKRVRQVTRNVAAIETVALNIPGRNHERLLEFHAGNDLGADFGNWYVPTTPALAALCVAAGFNRVEVVVGPPEMNPPCSTPVAIARRLRDVLQTRPPLVPQPEPKGYFRTLLHAYV